MNNILNEYKDYNTLLENAKDVSNILDSYEFIEEKKPITHIPNNVCYTKDDFFGFFKLNKSIIPSFVYKTSDILEKTLNLSKEEINGIINFDLFLNTNNNTLNTINDNSSFSNETLYGADAIKHLLDKKNYSTINDLVYNRILVYPETFGALIYQKNNTFFKHDVNRLYFEIFTYNKKLSEKNLTFSEKIILLKNLQTSCDKLFDFYEQNKVKIYDKRYLGEKLFKDLKDRIKIYNNNNNLGCNIVLPYKYLYGEDNLVLLINDDGNNYTFSDCGFVNNYFMENSINVNDYKDILNNLMEKGYNFDNSYLTKTVQNDYDLLNNTIEFINTIIMITSSR